MSSRRSAITFVILRVRRAKRQKRIPFGFFAPVMPAKAGIPFGFIFRRDKKMEKRFWVYIVTDRPYGTLYVGVTNDLARRIWEHREGMYKGFTKKYGLKQLVYYENYPTAEAAIRREKNIKAWKREWKTNRIKEFNSTWGDLYEDLQK
jgi:putative endonuclease